MFDRSALHTEFSYNYKINVETLEKQSPSLRVNKSLKSDIVKSKMKILSILQRRKSC